ncbi:MAG: hypothetical protein JNK66_05800 [Chitinophagales bacterium]|nr:hypothetical protein [Chitinophagales bacterium]
MKWAGSIEGVCNMKNKISSKVKKILDEGLDSYANTTERVNWEEIKTNIRIKQGLKDADEGNVKEWKVVKKNLLKRITKK